jgi:hypothetical protein
MARIAILIVALCLVASPVRTGERAEGFFHAYRTSQTLEAGRTYIIETVNLRKRDSLQYYPPATSILVIDRAGSNDRGTIVAHGGTYDSTLRSRVRFTPSETQSYRIVVSSHNTLMPVGPNIGYSLQCGRADLRFTDQTTNLSRTISNIAFCGEGHYVTHHAGECFRTGRRVGVDPYLYFIPLADFYGDVRNGGAIEWDDDGRDSYNAQICFSGHGAGWMLTTSQSVTNEGPGTIDLTDHTRLMTSAWQELGWDSDRAFFYVFRTRVSLAAGRAHLIQTTDLRKRNTFQSPAPDTVLYVIDRDAGRVLARNDDGFPGSFTSQVVVTVPTSKEYDVVVRSRTASSVGTMDLVVDGSVVSQDAHFAGERLRAILKAGTILGSEDCIETDRRSGNPYLFWFPHPANYEDDSGFVVMNDNGGAGLNAKVCFSDFRRHFPTGDVARGMLLLGSSSTTAEGRTDFYISGSDHW